VNEDPGAITASVCADPQAAEALAAFAGRRRAALRFWLIWTAAGLILGPACYVSLAASGWGALAWRAAIALTVGPVLIGASALGSVKEDLKLPVLAAAAAAAGFDYQETDFDPPGYPEAREALFPWLTGEEFQDLFMGKDSDGRGLAMFEARLKRGSGRSERLGFQGQVYWIEREPRATSATIVLPGRGLLEFGNPGGLDPVGFSTDPDFDARFQIYSDTEAEARALFSDPLLRRLLLELREGGKAYAFAGRYNAVIAVAGANRFEPGGLIDSSGGKERVRTMATDLCDGLATLRKLKERLG
jgi:hypothetical protein